MNTFWGLDATAWTALYTVLTFGLLVVAVVAAAVAWRQWRVSREQIMDSRRAAQEASRPYVIVTAAESAASRHLFDLAIHNMGARPAFQVKVHLDPPPVRARETHDDYVIANAKLLTEPIQMLAPGQELRTFWDSYIEREGRSDLPILHTVTVSYEDSSHHEYAETSVIDLDAMRGAMFAEVQTVHTIGKTLADLTDHLKHASLLTRHGTLDTAAVVETHAAHLQRQHQEALANQAHRLRSAVWSENFTADADPDKAQRLHDAQTRLHAFLTAHPELVTEEDHTEYGFTPQAYDGDTGPEGVDDAQGS